MSSDRLFLQTCIASFFISTGQVFVQMYTKSIIMKGNFKGLYPFFFQINSSIRFDVCTRLFGVDIFSFKTNTTYKSCSCNIQN